MSGDLETIARPVCERFDVSMDEIKQRHRGNKISMARMAFAYSADRHYRTPHRLIADSLNVGTTAISEMSRKGRAIFDESNMA
jgi:chromosomal replication initiation ATPase DnaA